ncbi:MAG: site-specific integrase [Candidatus Korarchaeum sp.]
MDLLERKAKSFERIISELPRDLAERLQTMLVMKGVSVHTRLTYAQALGAWWRATGVDPVSATREDIRRFLESYEGYRKQTVDLFLGRLKTFVKWVNGDLTDAWKIIKSSKVDRELREKILKPEEVKALIRAADKPKIKAIISILYEGALRLGELCSLRMRDLEFTQYGFKVRVSGKTGERVIPLYDSAPYLRAWLQNHPNPRNPNMPLFTGKGLEPMKREAVYAAIDRAAKRAGINKKVHPHMLRHTRLTELAKTLTEQELKVFSGWVKDSRMASVYVHLSGRDVEDAMLKKVYGLSTVEEEAARPLKPEVCPNCGYMNPADAKFCLKCGYPLSEEATRELKTADELMERLLEEMLRDPEIRGSLIKWMSSRIRDR